MFVRKKIVFNIRNGRAKGDAISLAFPFDYYSTKEILLLLQIY